VQRLGHAAGQAAAFAVGGAAAARVRSSLRPHGAAIIQVFRRNLPVGTLSVASALDRPAEKLHWQAPGPADSEAVPIDSTGCQWESEYHGHLIHSLLMYNNIAQDNEVIYSATVSFYTEYYTQ
jgi:hypothetical protein